MAAVAPSIDCSVSILCPAMLSCHFNAGEGITNARHLPASKSNERLRKLLHNHSLGLHFSLGHDSLEVTIMGDLD